MGDVERPELPQVDPLDVPRRVELRILPGVEGIGKLARGVQGVCREEEAVFGGADRSGTEAD